MSKTLTPKQEMFCKKFIELGNASDAYRAVYNASNMKAETINRKAFDLQNNGKITARISELHTAHQQRHNVTVDSLLAELEDARQLALAADNPSVMVSATMGKAKITGLDKKVIEHTGIEQLIIVTHGDD